MTTHTIVSYDGFKKVKETKIYVRAGVMMSLSIEKELFVTKAKMALFGMVWLLRVRAEMRRCAKCRKEELLKLQKEQAELQMLRGQQQQHQHSFHRSVEQQTEGAVAIISGHGSGQESQDGVSPSTTNTTFYNLDPPGPGGTYCEIHGFIPPKEGKIEL